MSNIQQPEIFVAETCQQYAVWRWSNKRNTEAKIKLFKDGILIASIEAIRHIPMLIELEDNCNDWHRN